MELNSVNSRSLFLHTPCPTIPRVNLAYKQVKPETRGGALHQHRKQYNQTASSHTTSRPVQQRQTTNLLAYALPSTLDCGTIIASRGFTFGLIYAGCYSCLSVRAAAPQRAVLLTERTPRAARNSNLNDCRSKLLLAGLPRLWQLSKLHTVCRLCFPEPSHPSPIRLGQILP